MTLIIIDFRDARRNLLQARLRVLPGGEVVCVRSYTELPNITRPCLALWHVGTAQDDHERGRLMQQLSTFMSEDESWIAGYTAGNIDESRLPLQGDNFVIRDDAAADHLPQQFADAVDNLVGAVRTAGIRFAAGELQRVWRGWDPLLDAKLAVLIALSAGVAASEESLSLLRVACPWLDSEIADLRPGDTSALASLRDRLGFYP